MSRSSFARSVARAAASGGSRNYRARRPVLWYAALIIIVALGVGLIVYSRNESLAGPSTSNSKSSSASGPTATSHWAAALGIDLCGKLQPVLPASSNLTKVGIRTFGDGLIDIDPAVVANSSAYEGANATLGLFAKDYKGFDLTDTSIKVPFKQTKAMKNGDTCTGTLHGKATLVASVWTSPTASPTTVTTNITGIRLKNDQMITLAFVPKGATIPEPSSKSTLISTVAANAKIGSINTTTTTAPTATTTPATTTTTTASSTTTTTPSSTTTTTKS